MTAKVKPRERFHLPSLVLDPRILSERPGEVIGAVLADNRSSAPLRVLLERRSTVDFIKDLHSSLCADGISSGEAADAICHVINAPSLAVRRGQRDPRRTDILQAVAIDDSGDGGIGRMILVITATVVASKPPTVEDATVELLPIDWELLDDRCALAVQLETWWRAYKLRPANLGQSYEDAPTSCGWFGSPDERSYREVRNGWESSITSLAAIFGIRIYIAHSPHEAGAQALHDRVDFGIVVNGTTGWDDVRGHFDSSEKDLLEAGAPGTDFESLLSFARRVIVKYVFDCINPPLPEPRTLAAGETIYHRKIPPQPRKFDRFDQGSTTPCQHGAESFVRWSGDKAIKGMRRIYANFDARMLYHCSRFPKCGVYAVKG